MPKYQIWGRDMFDYEDYPTAEPLFDDKASATVRAIERTILQRTLQPGGMSDRYFVVEVPTKENETN